MGHSEARRVSTSGGAIVNANNNPQAWNGDFAFAGTSDLDLGTGAVTLGADCVLTVNGSSSSSYLVRINFFFVLFP